MAAQLTASHQSLYRYEYYEGHLEEKKDGRNRSIGHSSDWCQYRWLIVDIWRIVGGFKFKLFRLAFASAATGKL